MEARMPKDGPTQEGPDQISPISWTILNNFQARSHMGRRDVCRLGKRTRSSSRPGTPRERQGPRRKRSSTLLCGGCLRSPGQPLLTRVGNIPFVLQGPVNMLRTFERGGGCGGQEKRREEIACSIA